VIVEGNLIRPQATVVVPTRNRAHLAITAISSVLNQAESGVRIVVSDNSTNNSDRSDLESFCAKLDPNQVTYIRPETPMAMSLHWDWALRAALRLSSDSHLTYLSDRMVFKEGTLRDLLDIATLHSERVITYGEDMVDDSTEPVQLHMQDWTGKLFEIDSAHLLYLSSRAFCPPCIPRMLNSLVPRRVLSEMVDRFGNVFGSISPDFCFAYRCLFLLDSLLYYDKATLIQYAMSRSNGMSYARGVPGPDNADFIDRLPGVSLNYATPIPEFQSNINAVLNEYCVVKAETGSPKFPEVDRRRYLAELGLGLRHLRDPYLARRMKRLLRSNGWTGFDNALSLISRILFLIRGQPSWVVRRIARAISSKLLPKALADSDTRIVSEWLMRFPSTSAAIRYANQSPRRMTTSLGYLRRCKLTDPPGHLKQVRFDDPATMRVEVP
jgi:glycosyltransferase involved in cell wall biosynthesis